MIYLCKGQRAFNSRIPNQLLSYRVRGLAAYIPGTLFIANNDQAEPGCPSQELVFSCRSFPLLYNANAVLVANSQGVGSHRRWCFSFLVATKTATTITFLRSYSRGPPVTTPAITTPSPKSRTGSHPHITYHATYHGSKKPQWKPHEATRRLVTQHDQFFFLTNCRGMAHGGEKGLPFYFEVLLQRSRPLYLAPPSRHQQVH